MTDDVYVADPLFAAAEGLVRLSEAASISTGRSKVALLKAMDHIVSILGGMVPPAPAALKLTQPTPLRPL